MTPRARSARLPGTTPERSLRYLRLVGALCRDRGWPTPIAEHPFHPDRRWRFDLAWPEHWIAVEVEGGIFAEGRHVRGAALVREYEKLNAAQILGWIVLLVIPEQLTNGILSDTLDAYFARWYPSTLGRRVLHSPPSRPGRDAR